MTADLADLLARSAGRRATTRPHETSLPADQGCTEGLFRSVACPAGAPDAARRSAHQANRREFGVDQGAARTIFAMLSGWTSAKAARIVARIATRSELKYALESATTDASWLTTSMIRELSTP